MTAKGFQQWPSEWSVIFAVRVNGSYIPGKVRLMKYVAILQRDGFPVKNRFINAEMGPYDEAVHQAAMELSKYDFLRVEEADSGREKKRVDYRLTAAGEKMVDERILPLLDDLPFRDSFYSHFNVTHTRFRKTKTPDVVSNLHQELHLDDVNRFQEALTQTIEETTRCFRAMEKRFVDYCPVCLRVLGALEFSKAALERIRDEWIFHPYSGKNHVLYNAERLVPAASKLIDHIHTDDPRMAEDANLRSSVNEVNYFLHCIEWNCYVYGILQPIQAQLSEVESLEVL